MYYTERDHRSLSQFYPAGEYNVEIQWISIVWISIDAWIPIKIQWSYSGLKMELSREMEDGIQTNCERRLGEEWVLETLDSSLKYHSTCSSLWLTSTYIHISLFLSLSLSLFPFSFFQRDNDAIANQIKNRGLFSLWEIKYHTIFYKYFVNHRLQRTWCEGVGWLNHRKCVKIAYWNIKNLVCDAHVVCHRYLHHTVQQCYYKTKLWT